MGQKLMRFFELVQAEAGPQGRARLAMKTATVSAIAKDVPDSPELIAKFKSAYKEITGKDAPIS